MDTRDLTELDGVDDLLVEAGFDPDENVLTRRQAQVLALREREFSQDAIADILGTTRANISSIEASARRNVDRANETVAVAAALRAPVRVRIEPGTDLFDVPDAIFRACDETGTKVAHPSAEVVRAVRQDAPRAIDDGQVVTPLLIGVDKDGTITIRAATESA